MVEQAHLKNMRTSNWGIISPILGVKITKIWTNPPPRLRFKTDDLNTNHQPQAPWVPCVSNEMLGGIQCQPSNNHHHIQPNQQAPWTTTTSRPPRSSPSSVASASKSTWKSCFGTWELANLMTDGHPSPRGHVPPPEIDGVPYDQGLLTRWVPSIRPAIKPLFR